MQKNFFKCRTKIVLFGYFWVGTRKSYCTVDFLHQHPHIFHTKFCQKIKVLKFGTKFVLIGYFGLECQKTNVKFEISILKFVNMQSFIQKQNISKRGTKIPYLGIFGLQFNKNYFQIFNQHTPVCETIKFHLKRK